MSSTETVTAPPTPVARVQGDDGSVAQPRPTRTVQPIPRPHSLEDQRKWQLEQMAGAFRIFAKLGFADGGSGHISLRDPVEPETFWINPYGVHFGVLTVSDMVHVDAHGDRIGGNDARVNKAGFIIHSAIHAARPDVHAACHVHSPFARAWSTFGRPVDMLNQDSCMFHDDLAVYAAFGGVVFAPQEGRRIAAALGPRHKNIILQNHGTLTCGGTVAEAAAFFVALERACHTQLLVEAATAPASVGGAVTGLRKTFVADEEAAYTKQGTGSPEVMYMQFVPEYQMILKETKGDFLV
ncbi:putative aldolase [Xylariaceae sp. FL0804]|nr:putative aldolase [Xylariaceae sp. FL0804]